MFLDIFNIHLNIKKTLKILNIFLRDVLKRFQEDSKDKTMV